MKQPSRLTKALHDKGLSKSEVARRAEVSPSTVARFLTTGEGNRKVARTLSRALGTPIPALKAMAGTVVSTSPTPFEGAAVGRRMGLWGMNLSGPNVAVQSSMHALRSRSRELVRNNPWADSGVDSLVSNLIGTGITPYWPDERLQALWNRWTSQSDADGVTDFYGQQALAAREVVESGEVLARFRGRLPQDGLVVPLQIQLLEPDYLDDMYDGMILPSGNWTRMGIEFDANIGSRVAYWIRRYHPGDFTPMSAFGSYETVRVPAEEVCHVFLAKRAGQVRGLPWLSSLILRLYELDHFDDATLLRQKIGNLLTGFLYDTGEASPLGASLGQNQDGFDEVGLEPGAMWRVPAGTSKIEWSTPPDTGANFAPYMKYNLRAVAKGLKLTYEQLTGDHSDSNFSSWRSAIAEFRRWAEMMQWSIYIHAFCRPVALRFASVAIGTGKTGIDAKAYNADPTAFAPAWRPPRWSYVDPLKDMQAEELAVRDGFKARSTVISEQGEDPVAVEKQIAEDNQRADALGLVFDSDPRKVAKKGIEQPTPSAIEGPQVGDAGTAASKNAA